MASVVEVAPATANQSAIYRRTSSKDRYPELDGVTTLYQLFDESSKKHAELPALGRRPLAVGLPPRPRNASPHPPRMLIGTPQH